MKGHEVAVIIGPGGDNLHDIQMSSGVLNMDLQQVYGRACTVPVNHA